MKTIKNHVQLIGNIGQDPQVTNLENGKIVAQFSMATNENYKDSKGQKQSETHWHSVVAWENWLQLLRNMQLWETKLPSKENWRNALIKPTKAKNDIIPKL